jgi:hypothetical protein
VQPDLDGKRHPRQDQEGDIRINSTMNRVGNYRALWPAFAGEKNDRLRAKGGSSIMILQDRGDHLGRLELADAISILCVLIFPSASFVQRVHGGGRGVVRWVCA